MQAKLNNIFTLFFILSSGVLLAQEKNNEKEEIDTQKLIIVKPYSPTVNDAIKVRQNPGREEDSKVLGKKKIEYDIFSVPVASTFNPEKGKASGVKRSPQPDLYNNYAALGIGNYTNIFAEFYSNIEFDRRQNMTIGFEHNSSQGGIKDVDLDDKYYDTGIDLAFNAEEDNFHWDLKFGFQHQLYNWYRKVNNYDVSPQLASAKLKHNYTAYSVGGDIIMKKGVFNKASLTYRHFGDDFHSNENQIMFNPKFRFPAGKETAINADINLDYLGGKFGHAHANPKNYGWFNLGITPSFSLSGDKLTMNIGAEFVYSADTENSKNDVYLFPKVKASYHVAGDYFKVYGGVDGGLEQNSYYDFTQGNPFVSPDLSIRPTNTKFNVFFGGKGKVVEDLHYDVRASFKSQENKALFAANSFDPTSRKPNLNAPYYNNSFMVRYDDVKTLSFQGSLGYDLNEDFNVGVNATYYHYSTDDEARAWNLPELEASINADYQISDRWAVGADILFVGERKDFINNAQRVKVDGYVDANLRVDFQVSDRFGIFARGNNLFNDNYDRWYQYRVQGIQGMLGVSYQF